MRPLRARLVTSHSGGSGTPVVQHYDCAAGSLLDGESLPTSGGDGRDHCEERDWRRSQRDEERHTRKPGPELSQRRKS